jgi:hypothetical protein
MRVQSGGNYLWGDTYLTTTMRSQMEPAIRDEDLAVGLSGRIEAILGGILTHLHPFRNTILHITFCLPVLSTSIQSHRLARNKMLSLS